MDDDNMYDQGFTDFLFEKLCKFAASIYLHNFTRFHTTEEKIGKKIYRKTEPKIDAGFITNRCRFYYMLHANRVWPRG